MGKDIQQDFGVRVGVQVTQVALKQLLGQGICIGEGAVVGKGDAVRRVDVERLCQRSAGTPRRGVAHMADTDAAAQTLHMVLAKNIAHQPFTFALAKFPTVAGHDPRRILPAVLQHGQCIVNIGGDIRLTNYTDQATHAFFLSSAQPGYAVTAGTSPDRILSNIW